MFDVVTAFGRGSRVAVEVQAVDRTNLHAHPNALELVYVLAGTVHVRVSSEDFDLAVGDYAAINRDDPHLLEGSTDNVTAIVHFDLEAYREVYAFADKIMFACESFDLARYRHQEALLRAVLLDIIEAAVVQPDPLRIDSRGADMVEMLCTGYTIADYYQRDYTATQSQRSKLHSISAAIDVYLDSRDVLQEVADAHHYSKSHVSHFVKNVTAMSFTNIVTSRRVMRAERMLLTTNQTMRDISIRCGFSDVKYFTRHFSDWFAQTPAEYRTSYRPLTLRDNATNSVPPDVVADLVAGHRSRVASPTELPRLSITPIVLNNVGSRSDLFEKVRQFSTDVPRPPRTDARTGSRRKHLVPIGIDGGADIPRAELERRIAAVSAHDASACLVVQHAGTQSTTDLLTSLAQNLPAVGELDVRIWVVYSSLNQRIEVDQAIAHIEDLYDIRVQAILSFDQAKPHTRRTLPI